jgi:hypothetical protein
LRARIRNTVLRCARADLPSDEAVGLYFDARSVAAGIIRAELSSADQAVYDEQRAAYVGICRSFRGEELEKRTWTPLLAPSVQHGGRAGGRAPRRARPRGRRTARRAVAGRRAAVRAGPGTDDPPDDPDDVDLDPPAGGLGVVRAAAQPRRPGLGPGAEHAARRTPR